MNNTQLNKLTKGRDGDGKLKGYFNDKGEMVADARANKVTAKLDKLPFASGTPLSDAEIKSREYQAVTSEDGKVLGYADTDGKMVANSERVPISHTKETKSGNVTKLAKSSWGGIKSGIKNGSELVGLISPDSDNINDTGNGPTDPSQNNDNTSTDEGTKTEKNNKTPN